MKTKIIIGFVILSGLISCSKNDSNLSLAVSVDPKDIVDRSGETIIVKRTEKGVTFKISAEADMINFYSGEIGKKYEYRNRTIAEGTPILSFSFNSNRVKPEHPVRLLASADFKGQYDSLGITRATWTDLTPQEMNDYRGVNTLKPMPKIDLSAFGGGKPVFLAYQLVITSEARLSNPTISSLLLVNNQTDGAVSTVLPDGSQFGFSFITLSPNGIWKSKPKGSASWQLVSSSTAISVNTTPFDAVNLGQDFTKDGLSHEMWAISKAIYLDKTSPDRGKTIKDIQSATENYTYVFPVGKYKVTFEAVNVGIKGVKESTIKEISLEVIE